MRKLLITSGLISILGLSACVQYEDGKPVEETDSDPKEEMSEENKAEIQRQQEEHDKKETEEKAEEERIAKEQAEKEEQERLEKEEAEKQKAETEAKEEEESKPEYEMIDGIAVFTDAKEPTLSENNMVSNFSIEMTDALKKHHEEIENGAIFRLANTLEDTYGNEEQVYTLVVYYSQDTIEKINYDNWPSLVASGLYDTADTVLVHYVLNNNKHAEGKGADNAPPIVGEMFGAEYEE